MQPRDAFAALARAVRDPDIQRDTLVMMADDHERALPPPTVAELLAALPEPPGGRGPGLHRVEWEYDDMRIRAVRYGLSGLIVERRLDGEWSRTNLNHADLNQPARLVEVSP